MNTVICTVNGKRGEYTGYSMLTKKHYVSLYNGERLELTQPHRIKFERVKHTRYNQWEEEVTLWIEKKTGFTTEQAQKIIEAGKVMLYECWTGENSPIYTATCILEYKPVIS